MSLAPKLAAVGRLAAATGVEYPAAAMKPDELGPMRTLLLQRRAELLKGGDVPVEFEQSEVVTRPDEDAAPLVEMTQVIASNRNRARTAALAAIDDALRRMADDPEEFGVCEACDEPIAQRRLLLVPEATLCATCQREDEQANSTRGRSRRHLTDFR
ncbi:TraR/DksA family transcriptional regulator [Nannocystis pusilla]|uniref:TraR/DksA family transcriptional regulator n=1 Tax=Nannocystis pusilla TaxID=889268 RepID=A0ABS7TZQ2_9BACT|nr:TraR/DksA family transcriptional regulator [Nannocystis pusilla]MBZ5713675.1 TraR/DksA family transcriptional regulator [Nannocystis pusilla]